MTNLHKRSKAQLISMIIQQKEELARLQAENVLLSRNSTLQLEDEIQLKDIMTYMPGNIFCKDKYGIYVGCNRNVARLLGATSVDEVIGKRDRDFLNIEIASKLEIIDQEVMASGKTMWLEEKGVNENKESAIFLSHKIPFHNRLGNIIGILGISFDITERKKIEENLRIAKSQAEAAYEAKTQFLAIINHELRTPVTGLLGLLGFLKQDTLTAQEEKTSSIPWKTAQNIY